MRILYCTALLSNGNEAFELEFRSNACAVHLLFTCCRLSRNGRLRSEIEAKQRPDGRTAQVQYSCKRSSYRYAQYSFVSRTLLYFCIAPALGPSRAEPRAIRSGHSVRPNAARRGAAKATRGNRGEPRRAAARNSTQCRLMHT